jgi:uridine kinase
VQASHSDSEAGRAPRGDGRRPIVIGVAGGSGSGKTTVVREIERHLGADRVTVIHHDSYYRDASHLAPAERQRINYDHPDALETALLVAHLRQLRAGHGVDVPVYDFANHVRMQRTRRAEPRKVVILDGLLILWERELRELLDIRVFVDTDSDLRVVRRLQRDINERGRSVESVIHQYLETVRPMHLEFVAPSKRYADLIIPEGGENRVAVDMLITKVSAILGT